MEPDVRTYGPMRDRPKEASLRYPSVVPSIGQQTERTVEEHEDGWYVTWTTTYAE